MTLKQTATQFLSRTSQGGRIPTRARPQAPLPDVVALDDESPESVRLRGIVARISKSFLGPDGNVDLVGALEAGISQQDLNAVVPAASVADASVFIEDRNTLKAYTDAEGKIDAVAALEAGVDQSVLERMLSAEAVRGVQVVVQARLQIGDTSLLVFVRDGGDPQVLIDAGYTQHAIDDVQAILPYADAEGKIDAVAALQAGVAQEVLERILNPDSLASTVSIVAARGIIGNTPSIEFLRTGGDPQVLLDAGFDAAEVADLVAITPYLTADGRVKVSEALANGVPVDVLERLGVDTTGAIRPAPIAILEPPDTLSPTITNALRDEFAKIESIIFRGIPKDAELSPNDRENILKRIALYWNEFGLDVAGLRSSFESQLRFYPRAVASAQQHIMDNNDKFRNGEISKENRDYRNDLWRARIVEMDRQEAETLQVLSDFDKYVAALRPNLQAVINDRFNNFRNPVVSEVSSNATSQPSVFGTSDDIAPDDDGNLNVSAALAAGATLSELQAAGVDPNSLARAVRQADELRRAESAQLSIEIEEDDLSLAQRLRRMSTEEAEAFGAADPSLAQQLRDEDGDLFTDEEPEEVSAEEAEAINQAFALLEARGLAVRDGDNFVINAAEARVRGFRDELLTVGLTNEQIEADVAQVRANAQVGREFRDESSQRLTAIRERQALEDEGVQVNTAGTFVIPEHASESQIAVIQKYSNLSRAEIIDLSRASQDQRNLLSGKSVAPVVALDSPSAARAFSSEQQAVRIAERDERRAIIAEEGLPESIVDRKQVLEDDVKFFVNATAIEGGFGLTVEQQKKFESANRQLGLVNEIVRALESGDISVKDSNDLLNDISQTPTEQDIASAEQFLTSQIRIAGTAPIAGAFIGPIATYRDWKQSGPIGRTVDVGLDVLGVAGLALPAAGIARSAGSLTGAARAGSIAGAIVDAEILGPSLMLADAPGALKSTARTLFDPVEVILRRERIPGLEQATGTFRLSAGGGRGDIGTLQSEEVTDLLRSGVITPADVKNAVSEATTSLINAQPAKVRIGDSDLFVEVGIPPAQQATGAAAFTGSPDIRNVLGSGFRIEGAEGGLFVSFSPHSRFAEKTALGAKAPDLNAITQLQDKAERLEVAGSTLAPQARQEAKSALDSWRKFDDQISDQTRGLIEQGKLPNDPLPGVIWIRDRNLLAQLADTEQSVRGTSKGIEIGALGNEPKIFEGKAEFEKIIPNGIELPAASQTLFFRGANGKRYGIAVVGEPLTNIEIAKLKLGGTKGSIQNIFSPPIAIKSGGATSSPSFARDADLLETQARQATLAGDLRRADSLLDRADIARAEGIRARGDIAPPNIIRAEQSAEVARQAELTREGIGGIVRGQDIVANINTLRNDTTIERRDRSIDDVISIRNTPAPRTERLETIEDIGDVRIRQSISPDEPILPTPIRRVPSADIGVTRPIFERSPQTETIRQEDRTNSAPTPRAPRSITERLRGRLPPQRGRVPVVERAIPGERIPGMRIPGERIPGERIPGERSTGERIPGMRIPGEPDSDNQSKASTGLNLRKAGIDRGIMDTTVDFVDGGVQTFSDLDAVPEVGTKKSFTPLTFSSATPTLQRLPWGALDLIIGPFGSFKFIKKGSKLPSAKNLKPAEEFHGKIDVGSKPTQQPAARQSMKQRRGRTL